MKVYVVIGTTGEYSDRMEWLVCGFLDEEKAKERVLLAEGFARDSFISGEFNRYDDVEIKNPYDGKFQIDYTGTDYYYAEIEVEE